MKNYKKVIINNISEIQLGDIFYVEDIEEYAIVSEVGKTFIHDHHYFRLCGSKGMSGKAYSEDLDKSEEILRPTKHDAILGERE